MSLVVLHQCHLDLGSEMKEDDEVISRYLPQCAIVHEFRAQGAYKQALNTRDCVQAIALLAGELIEACITIISDTVVSLFMVIQSSE